MEVRKTSDKFFVFIGQNKRIQCYSWGEGPVILFTHGWAGRGTQFRNFFTVVNNNGYRAVAFDGPAHGLSEGKSTDLMEFKEAIFAIHEKIGAIHAIIAHSFGGVASLFAIMSGLPVKTLINIASPTIGDEIISTYLRALRGKESTGDYLKKHVLQQTGKPFYEFTSLYFVQNLADKLNLLLIYDKDDKEVTPEHGRKLKESYPAAELLITEGLGHTRILKDEGIIRQCVTFIHAHASG